MLFQLDPDSALPKYEQIVSGIISAIADGRVGRGDALPTVARICADCGVSKETALKSYAILRRRGIVRVVPKTGYFVQTESVQHRRRAMLLFDEFTPYKQDLYAAFRNALDSSIRHDIFFHHCNIDLFESLLIERAPDYDLCALMPFDHPRMASVVRRAKCRELVLLDRHDGFQPQSMPFIGQDFTCGLHAALHAAADLFGKYQRLVAVLPQHDARTALAFRTNHTPSADIKRACASFAREAGLRFATVSSFDKHRPVRGDACLIIDEEDLVAAVEASSRLKLRLGRDLGILAYNESSIHRIVAGGLTTVSTDFAAMGRQLARYVTGTSAAPLWKTIPTRVIRRHTL